MIYNFPAFFIATLWPMYSRNHGAMIYVLIKFHPFHNSEEMARGYVKSSKWSLMVPARVMFEK